MSKAMEYVLALLQVQKDGVMIVENVMNCCGSCTGSEIAQEFPGADVAYMFAGQGREIRWDAGNDLPYEYDEDGRQTGQFGKQYWNFTSPKAAEAVVRAFRGHGFTVEWNGSEGKCVTVDYSGLELFHPELNEVV